VTLVVFYLLGGSWRERFGIAKAGDAPTEMHSTGKQRQRRQYQTSLISVGITLSTKTKTVDLEAGIKKPKDQVSSRKRHYGPEKRKYQSNYTGLADLMAENPEKAIVRRFTHLNVKNLLYLQAELACLEEDLNNAIEHDKNFEETEDYARSWALLEESDPYQDMVPDHIEGVEEHRSRLERSPSWQHVPVPHVNEYSDQAQMGFAPSGSAYIPDAAYKPPSRRETGKTETSEDDMKLEPTESWPGGMSHIRSTQPQTLRQRRSHSANMSSRQSDELEQLSDSGRGRVDKSRHSKKSSQEPNTERPNSHSHKGKKHGRHQDQDDHTRPIQRVQSATSDRRHHNDAPTLQRHLVHQIRTKLEKYSKLAHTSIT
jgi:hypothetical protein